MSESNYQRALEILAAQAGDGSFFDRAAEALTMATGHRWAAVFVKLDSGEIKAEAFWEDGRRCDPFQRPLSGTPCSSLYEHRDAHNSVLFFNDLKMRFPKFDVLDASSYQGALFFDDAGQPLGHIATLHDRPVRQSDAERCFFELLAQRIGAELRQRKTRDQLTLCSRMIENTHHMMGFIDRHYVYRVASRGYESILGLPRDQLLGLSVEEIHGSEAFQSHIKNSLDRCLEGETLNFRGWVTLKDRRPVFADSVLAPYIDEQGRITGIIISSHDITEAKLKEDRFIEFAHTDPLTGLPNRRYLYNRMAEELSRAKRHGTSAQVYYIDLDGFKDINDSMGHTAGDTVLEIIAKRLRGSLREEDLLARIGGDEFVLLTAGEYPREHNPEDVAMMVNKMMADIARPIWLHGDEVVVEASIGPHILNADDDSVEDVIHQADLAMYRVKTARIQHA